MIIELRKVRKPRKYAKLTPPQEANNKLLAAIRWVCRALSKGDTRAILTHLHIKENGDIAATDARRLHVATDVATMAAGMYRVLKNGPVVWLDKMDDDGLKYPAYEEHIPKSPPNTEEVKGLDNTILYRACLAASQVSGGGVFSVEYLDDAIPASVKGDKIEISGKTDLDAITIKHSLGIAVIMPIRMI